MPTDLTADRLREVLAYDAQTGAFTWRVTQSNRAKAGNTAGSLHRQDGYVYIRVDGVLHKAHRLAWLHVHGAWPTAGVDHVNGDRGQNGIANLRESTATMTKRRSSSLIEYAQAFAAQHMEQA